MSCVPDEAVEHAAALLERAYRMALALRACFGEPAAGPGERQGFVQWALAGELVELIDETRVALVLNAASCDKTTPVRSGCPAGSAKLEQNASDS